MCYYINAKKLHLGGFMLDIILDTIIDSVKILPFLYLTFLLMEFLEHKLSNKSKDKLEKSGKFGPLFGGIFGAFPQCGFSVAATNLYVAHIITLGTLIAVYLSTSDEMLPILLSKGASFTLILKFLFIKGLIGIFFGFIIDFVFRKKIETSYIHEICDDDHCDCDHGIIKSSIKHTLNIFIFLIIISFLLNFVMSYYGEDKLRSLFLDNNIFSPFISSLIGLIPNCGASVIITELYLSNVISFGSALAGLLTGSGVAILVLFKVNHNIKENIKILSLIYFIGVFCGIIMNFLGISI